MTLDEATERLIRLLPTDEQRQFATVLSGDLITALAKKQASAFTGLVAILATLDVVARNAKINLAELHGLVDAMRTMSNAANG